MNHDVITIGASAGGIEVLLELVRELPADLPASVFVVVHVPAGHESLLPELLTERGALPAKHPLHDEKIVPGRIYIAPPDNHLVVRQGSMEVVRGPKENGHRPAADVLFRTASTAYGSRVIGVVLSGYGDCGTAGMMSIKARGGMSVVQTPDSAQAPDMPRSVLSRVEVDHATAPVALAGLLARLAALPAGQETPVDGFVQQLEGKEPGVRAEVVCPICEGVLTEAQPGVFQHFRCHVGHAFSLESLVREQSEELERTLWAAVRALEESAALSRRLSLVERGAMRRSFAEKAATHAEQAEYLRRMLLHGQLLSAPDAEKVS
jgi:two-component system, chemotaxis family, protein-glutamate methylesterase/glutaminase